MRHSVLLTIWLVFTTLSPAAQKPAPATPAGRADFLPVAGVPGGVFLFERGTARPTHMDAFDGRPVVKSPDGQLGVTVTGPKASYEAWVTIDPSGFPDGPVQVWPIQASVAVLWRPDSQVFALTDNRYSNAAYLLLFGTSFRMGESDPGLGIPITDLTPIVRKAFEERTKKYYADHDYETLRFYAEALRWVGDYQLLVGVSAQTDSPSTFANRGVESWAIGYLFDVPHNTVQREVSKSQLLSEYGISVPEGYLP